MILNSTNAADTLLVVGNDHFGRALAVSSADLPGLILARDRSVTIARVLKLLRRRSVMPSSVLRQGWTAIRQCMTAQSPWPDAIVDISKNADLLNLAKQHGVQRFLLFRAGLIVNKAVLDSGIEVLNIHCAKLPKYGGLGSIERAIADNALKQCATLHRVTEKIDSGEILMETPYTLDPARSVAANEQTAYTAGIALGLQFLSERTLQH